MFAKIFNKIYRNILIFLNFKRSSVVLTIDNSEIDNIFFYQFKKTTVEFFYKRFNKTQISIADTPHYALAKAWISGNAGDIEEAKIYYSEYLKASWRTTDQSKIDQRIEDFFEQYQLIKNGKLKKPVILTKLSDSKDLYVVDGNHRTSVNFALNFPLTGKLIPFDLAFVKFTYMPGFYGLNRRLMPYQSIYFNNGILISGRRQDIEQRLKLIPEHVLKGKSILDVASNVGMSSIVARNFGASVTKGLEFSKEMVDIATRFSMLNGCYPQASFQQFNIDNDELDRNEVYDTCFMFSIYSHLNNPGRLNEIVKKHVASYVVFEAHPGHEYSQYLSFFESELFEKIEEIGILNTSIFNKKPSRKLWLCTKNSV